jgi:hypothetical protein
MLSPISGFDRVALVGRKSKTQVGSAPDLGRFSEPEADPLLGQ